MGKGSFIATPYNVTRGAVSGCSRSRMSQKGVPGRTPKSKKNHRGAEGAAGNYRVCSQKNQGIMKSVTFSAYFDNGLLRFRKIVGIEFSDQIMRAQMGQ